MRNIHRIIITAEALADLEGIANYICKSSPQHAASVAAKILESIDSLSLMPGRFKVVRKSNRKDRSIHAMVVRPFIIYYRVDDEHSTVRVVHIRHGSRRPPSHLN